jgi:hypothetical protein
MTRRWITLAILLIVGAIVFRLVTRRDPPAESLPRGEGTAYELKLTRFSEGEGLTCPPFRLAIAFDREPDLPRSVIEAQQGDDIVVVQTPSTLYVFYSELALTGFDGWIADGRDAQLVLCNVNRSPCERELQKLTESGGTIQRICLSGGKWWKQPDASPDAITEP